MRKYTAYLVLFLGLLHARCSSEAAGKFVQDNRNLVTLTNDQQSRLLQVNLPSYEAIVRRGVRAAINSGDKRKAVRIIEKQVCSKGKILRGLVRRRYDEAMLLLEGRY